MNIFCADKISHTPTKWTTKLTNKQSHTYIKALTTSKPVLFPNLLRPNVQRQQLGPCVWGAEESTVKLQLTWWPPFCVISSDIETSGFVVHRLLSVPRSNKSALRSSLPIDSVDLKNTQIGRTNGHTNIYKKINELNCRKTLKCEERCLSFGACQLCLDDLYL